MENTTLHRKCLICQSKSLTTLEDYKTAHLCKCSNCSFVFSKKIPTEKELVSHYNEYSRNDYLSPITIKRYHELLDNFDSFRKTNKILDVGCGIGYFLEVAKKRGWEAFGTEFTNEAVNICSSKGINVKQGILDPSNYNFEFDIITSFEVIEHINNPTVEINKFHSLLRKGGLVYITTPNFNSLLRYKLKSAYNVICYPEHLSYYTPKTLTKLFTNSKFKKASIQTTGISITRWRTSNGSKNQEFISQTSDDEVLRNVLERKYIFKLLKIFINWILSLLGVGDNIKGFFIKK